MNTKNKYLKIVNIVFMYYLYIVVNRDDCEELDVVVNFKYNFAYV